MLRNRIIVGVALAAMLGSGIAATVSDSQARESAEGPVTAQIVRTTPLEDVAKLDKPKPVETPKAQAPVAPTAPVTAPVVAPPVSAVSAVSAPVSVPVAPAVVSAKLTPAAPVVSAVAPPAVASAKPVAPPAAKPVAPVAAKPVTPPADRPSVPATCPTGKVMAEDHSCVPTSFYSSGPGAQMGGVYWDAVETFKASTPKLTDTQSRELFTATYLGTSNNPNQYGANTAALPSTKYPGIYHVFRIDPAHSVEAPCFAMTADGQRVCMQ